MGFLFPAMLAGLVGLAVPLALHLIARHRFPIQNFPTLWLLEKEKHTNVFAPKLIDPLQLLMRLLVVALLVLAMARLFQPGQTQDVAPHNLVVVIDCSASMKMAVPAPLDGGEDAAIIEIVGESGEETLNRAPIIEHAKLLASELLAVIEKPSQCALIAAEQNAVIRSPLGPSSQAALAALEKVAATDGTGAGLVHAVAAACKLVENRREVKSQIVVYTDMRAAAFTARAGGDLNVIHRVQKKLGDALEVVFVDLSGKTTENVAIQTAHIRGGPKVGDDAHVVATIVNKGEKPHSTKVGLTLGSRKAPASKQLELQPGDRAVVDLTVRMNRAVQSFVEVNIDEDDYVPDDSFSVPLNVADARRVLIVAGGREEASAELARIGQLSGDEGLAGEESIDGAKILQFVLNPGRELGLAHGTGIHTTTLSPGAVAAHPLSKYELIILYDVSSLAEPVLRDLDTFVRQGRSLLIIASKDVDAVKFNDSIAATRLGKLAAGNSRPADRKPLSPTSLGNDRKVEPAIGFDLAAIDHPLLDPFRDRLHGDLSAIRFTRIRGLLEPLGDGATVMLRGTGGESLGVEMPIDRGRIVLLTFGFELERGNIAMTRVFPPLMWRLVDYLTGRLKRRPPDVVPALTQAVLDVSEPEFSFATEFELAPVADTGGEPQLPQLDKAPPESLRPREGRVLVPPLVSGQYVLRKKQESATASLSGYSRIVYAHPDPRESEMAKVGKATIVEMFDRDVKTVFGAQPPITTPTGNELWKIVVAMLMGMYFLEAIAAWLLDVRREKKRVLKIE